MDSKAAVAVALVVPQGGTGFVLKIIMDIVSLAVGLTVVAIKLVVLLVIALVVLLVVYFRLRRKRKQH